jgi:beta-galactosidase
MYFQWRQSRGGAERFHSAMVPHAGPSSRVFTETSDLGAELAALSPVLGSTVDAPVALVADWSNGWAMQGTALPVSDLSFEDTNFAHYRPLWNANVAVDVVPPDADLSDYRLVVVPNLYAVSTDVAARLVEYVRAGGHLVMSYFSGIVDANERVHLGGYPGPFRELLGLTVEEFWPLPAGGTIGLGSGATGTLWSEWITLEGAEVLDTFAGGDLDGRPAITRHAFGSGVVTYLGTRLEDPATIMARALADAGVEPVVAPAGVEVVHRGQWQFFLNHNETEVTVPVSDGATNALTGEPLTKEQRLAGRGVLVVHVR